METTTKTYFQDTLIEIGLIAILSLIGSVITFPLFSLYIVKTNEILLSNYIPSLMITIVIITFITYLATRRV